MITYFCGAIKTENGLAYVAPIFQKIGPLGIWLRETESRKVIEDFDANDDYNFKQIYLNELSRPNSFGIIAFSKDQNANFALSERQLEELINMFDNAVAKAKTGEPLPQSWITEVKGSAIIQEPRYSK